MSEMATNASSDDTLIRDSQLSGFSAFKETLGFCCCRLLKKTAKYDLSSASKNNQEQQDDKPSFDNQAFEIERQARQDKLDKIAKTLPGATLAGPGGVQTITRSITTIQQGTPRSTTAIPQGTPRSLTTVTQVTPRSGIGLVPARSPINSSVSKTGVSTINKPSPLAVDTKNNKKDPDETVTEDSSEEESSSEDEKSSNSDSQPEKRAPAKHEKNRR